LNFERADEMITIKQLIREVELIEISPRRVAVLITSELLLEGEV